MGSGSARSGRGREPLRACHANPTSQRAGANRRRFYSTAWRSGRKLRRYPQLDGFQEAEGRYTPLSILSLPLGPETTNAPRSRGVREDLWSRDGCAGAIRALEHDEGRLHFAKRSASNSFVGS